MTRTILILITVCLAALAGCSGDKGKELYETARFEEQQHNTGHARQLYEEIVRKHPDTDYATRAAERLQALAVK